MTRTSPNSEDEGTWDAADNNPSKTQEQGGTHREDRQTTDSNAGEEACETEDALGESPPNDGGDGSARVTAPGDRFHRYMANYTRTINARRLEFRRRILRSLIAYGSSVRTFEDLERYYEEERMDLIPDTRSRKGACRQDDQCACHVDREIERDLVLDELDDEAQTIIELRELIRSLSGRGLRYDRRLELALREARQYQERKRQKMNGPKKMTKLAKNLRQNGTRRQEQPSSGRRRRIVIIVIRRQNRNPIRSGGRTMSALDHMRLRLSFPERGSNGGAMDHTQHRVRFPRNSRVHVGTPRQQPEERPEEHQEVKEEPKIEAPVANLNRGREPDASNHEEPDRKRLGGNQEGPGGKIRKLENETSEHVQDKTEEEPEESGKFPGKNGGD